jgi:hypothetical protein
MRSAGLKIRNRIKDSTDRDKKPNHHPKPPEEDRRNQASLEPRKNPKGTGPPKNKIKQTSKSPSEPNPKTDPRRTGPKEKQADQSTSSLPNAHKALHKAPLNPPDHPRDHPKTTCALNPTSSRKFPALISSSQSKRKTRKKVEQHE